MNRNRRLLLALSSSSPAFCRSVSSMRSLKARSFSRPRSMRASPHSPTSITETIWLLSASCPYTPSRSKPVPDQAREARGPADRAARIKASVAAKQFACRQLGLIGGDASLPPLEGPPWRGTLSETALYALERIPDSGAVLRDALAKSSRSGQDRRHLGLGKASRSARPSRFSARCLDKDLAVSGAAIRALGLIGTFEAASVLLKARQSVPGEARRLVEFSVLECGERLAVADQQEKAASIFGELDKPEASVELRLGALRGLSRLPVQPGSNVLPGLIELIRKEDPKAAANAIQVLLGMPGSGASRGPGAGVAELTARDPAGGDPGPGRSRRCQERRFRPLSRRVATLLPKCGPPRGRRSDGWAIPRTFPCWSKPSLLRTRPNGRRPGSV